MGRCTEGGAAPKAPTRSCEATVLYQIKRPLSSRRTGGLTRLFAELFHALFRLFCLGHL